MRLHRLATLRGLWSHPRADRAHLDRFRDAQLRRLLHHARANVPYYQRLLDRHDVGPDDVRGVADLGVVPTTSRVELQALAPEEIVARSVAPDRLIVRHTSGSSGRPLNVRRTWIEERILGAFRLRALGAIGLRATDRHADIVALKPRDANDSARLHRLLQAGGLYRQLQIHAGRAPEDIVRALRAFRPDVITGYAGVVARVAQTLLAAGEPVPDVRVLATHSEVLTPHMRRQIGAAFAAPVSELYDCHECNVVAWRCPQTGVLHTCDDAVVVEVLVGDRPAAPGERGEVVVTSLHSFAMPIIRYRLGDVATREEATCVCGQPFAQLGAVQGRTLDFFPLPSGRAVHPAEIIDIIGSTGAWIREYQITQERRDLVVLRAVVPVPPTARELENLRDQVAVVLGADVTLRIELVEELRLEPSAKFRLCRSLVA